jgi:hypothetical protein
MTGELCQRLQKDFGSLYDYLVDRDITWDASEERHTRKWEMLNIKTETIFDADSPGLPLTTMFIGFDSSQRYDHIPHPYPLLPTSNTPAATRTDDKKKKLFGLKKVKEVAAIPDPKAHFQLALAFNGATNINRLGTDFKGVFEYQALGLITAMLTVLNRQRAHRVFLCLREDRKLSQYQSTRHPSRSLDITIWYSRMPRIDLRPRFRSQVHRKGKLFPQRLPRRHSSLALVNRPARSPPTTRHRRTLPTTQPLLAPSRRMGARKTRSPAKEKPILHNKPIKSPSKPRQPEQQRPQHSPTLAKRANPTATIPSAEFPIAASSPLAHVPNPRWPDPRGAKIRTRDPQRQPLHRLTRPRAVQHPSLHSPARQRVSAKGEHKSVPKLCCRAKCRCGRKSQRGADRYRA